MAEQRENCNFPLKPVYCMSSKFNGSTAIVSLWYKDLLDLLLPHLSLIKKKYLVLACDII